MNKESLPALLECCCFGRRSVKAFLLAKLEFLLPFAFLPSASSSLGSSSPLYFWLSVRSPLCFFRFLCAACVLFSVFLSFLFASPGLPLRFLGFLPASSPTDFRFHPLCCWSVRPGFFLGSRFMLGFSSPGVLASLVFFFVSGILLCFSPPSSPWFRFPFYRARELPP